MLQNGKFDADLFQKNMEQTRTRARVKNKLRVKTFTEENRWWYVLAIIVGYLCQVVNVATGFSKPFAYLGGIFNFGFLGIACAAVVSLIVVVGMEYAARKNGEQLAEKWYFKGIFRTERLVVQLVLNAGIVVLSYLGAPDAARFMSGELTPPTVEKESVEAITQHYTGLITTANKAAEDFKATATWQGKLSSRNQRIYADKQQVATTLTAEMNAAIAEAKAGNSNRTKVAEDAFLAAKMAKDAEDGANGQVFGIIAIISCLLFFGLTWLKEYYEFMEAYEMHTTGQLTAEVAAKTTSFDIREELLGSVARGTNGTRSATVDLPTDSTVAKPSGTVAPPYSRGAIGFGQYSPTASDIQPPQQIATVPQREITVAQQNITVAPQTVAKKEAMTPAQVVTFHKRELQRWPSGYSDPSRRRATVTNNLSRCLRLADVGIAALPEQSIQPRQAAGFNLWLDDVLAPALAGAGVGELNPLIAQLRNRLLSKTITGEQAPA